MTDALFADLRAKTLRGTFCHAPRPDAVELLRDALVTTSESGRIVSVVRAEAPGHARALSEARAAGTLVEAPSGTYILPGFVDLHVHAPQYPQLGTALDVPLEVWLQTYTFPLEARYADPAFAQAVYRVLVGDLLAQGTTTAVYFATIHAPATKVLVDMCCEQGQRALVGKVAMDNPAECPDFYRDASTEAGLRDTEELIRYTRAQTGNDGRVLPVVTPRFIPSCTDEMLAGLGRIAAAQGCHVQTHCSESDWQHAHAQSRYGVSDAEALDRFGLLTRRSVLAHGNFLSDDDFARVRGHGAGVAHCAHSNVYFSNAVFPLRRALQQQVRVGLGTDIAGGPSASMFDACRMTVSASRMLEEGVDPAQAPDARRRPGTRVNFATAFHLATAGGGDVLDLPIGRFAPDQHFDAILVDPAAEAAPIRWLDQSRSDADAMERIVYGASRTNVARVWVGGRQVRPHSSGT